MASYTISPIWGAGAQLFDNNANPLSGGRIYTYLAGTTTQAATWTTPAGNVQNSNPIVANAAGRLSNEIWLATGEAYKFVLKDSNDVLIATYDNIPSLNAVPITNDASSISYEQGYTVTAGNFTIGATYLITSVGNTDFMSIGASANSTGIHFTATGIGSGTGTAEYSRTVQNKLQESVSVKDFGAVGDGVTDDTAAIQAAINYTGARSVFFPAGVYAVYGTTGNILTVNRFVHLIGETDESSVIVCKSTSPSANILYINTGAEGDYRGMVIKNLSIYNSGGTSYCSIYIKTIGSSALIESCKFGGGSSGYSMYVDNAMSHSKITLCTFTAGIYAYFGDAVKFDKNLMFGTNAALTVKADYGVRNIIISNNTIVNRDGWVIVEECDNLRIENNQFELGSFYTPSTNQNAQSAGVWLKGTLRAVYNCIILNNNFGGGTNYRNSIYLDNADKTVIDNNNMIAAGNVSSGLPYSDVTTTANTTNTYIGINNRVEGNSFSPRTDPFFKPRVIGDGYGTINQLQSGLNLNLQNSWLGGDFYKDTSGNVHFSQYLSDGSIISGDGIGIMPVYFRPYIGNDPVRRNLINNTYNFTNSSWSDYSLLPITGFVKDPYDLYYAQLIEANTSNDQHRIATNTGTLSNGGTYYLSFYVSKYSGATANTCLFELNDSSTYTKYIRISANLSAATVTVNENATYYTINSSAITAKNNGYYKIEVSLTTKSAIANSIISFVPSNVASSTATFVGDSTTKFNLFGVQLEQTGFTEYQQTNNTEYMTININKCVTATSYGGAGTVLINRNGQILVDSLPSNQGVWISSFQCDKLNEVEAYEL